MAFGRALALVMALYTTADFGSPQVPGAFVFDAGESVDGIRSPCTRHEARVAVVLPGPGADTVALAPSTDRPPRRRPVAHHAPSPPRPRSAPTVEPPPAADDH
jgi:hypothetical protein